LKLRRIERVLHGKNGGKYREQKEQYRDGGWTARENQRPEEKRVRGALWSAWCGTTASLMRYLAFKPDG
jgi:hypothetical protein